MLRIDIIQPLSLLHRNIAPAPLPQSQPHRWFFPYPVPADAPPGPLIKGMLTLQMLEELAANEEIDTVIVAITDMYGRMVGKRYTPGPEFATLSHRFKADRWQHVI